MKSSAERPRNGGIGSMVVELLGTPASGKSSLAIAVQDACRQLGLRPVSVVEAARPSARRWWFGRLVLALVPVRVLPADRVSQIQWAIFRLGGSLALGSAILSDPLRWWSLFHRQLKRPIGSDRQSRQVLKWVLRLTGDHRFITRHLKADEVLILDEGFVHRVVQLFTSPVEAANQREIESYLASIPRPDLIIDISVDLPVAVDRLNRRSPWQWLARRPKEDTETYLRHAHRAVTMTSRVARGQGWNIITFENNRDDLAGAIEALTADVVVELNTLTSLMSEGGPSSTVSSGVAMVVRLFDPWIGGMERQALKLSRVLNRPGQNVQIFTGRWFADTPKTSLVDGVTVRRHAVAAFGGRIKGGHTLAAITYMCSLGWVLGRQRSTYRVIHVHGLGYHTAIAIAVGRLCRKPVIVKLANSGTGSDIAKMRAGKQLHGSRFLLPLALRADVYVALNPLIREELLDAGVSAERIVEIPNGVEIMPRVGSMHRHSRRPTPADAAPPTVHIVFVGRLHEQKGLEVLMRAAALLESRFQVTLVGDGPKRSDLESLREELELHERVRFVGEVAEPRELIRNADVFVLPSNAEGLSNALLEAMAESLPSVVSDLPGNKVLVSDGIEGILVPPGDAPQLARALQRLIDDPVLRRSMGNAAWRRVAASFDIELIANSYLALYDKLVLRGDVGWPLDARS